MHNWRQHDTVPGLKLPFGIDDVAITHAVHIKDAIARPAMLYDELVEAAVADGMEWREYLTADQDQIVLDFDAPMYPWLYARFERDILEANATHFGLDLTYWHPMRLNRYRAGAKVGHRPHSDYQAPEPAKLAFSLVLVEPRQGGEMAVDNHGPAIALSAGDMLVFPAYELHWVNPVREGERVSLTGWMGGPPLR